MRLAVSATAPTLTGILFILLVIAGLPLVGVHGSTSSSGNTYSRPSWALGVVLPEGASLEGGGDMTWENVRNITVSVALPTIENPSDAVYATLNVMTADGVVLQVAAGIYPGNSTWLVYSMYIANVMQVPQHYTWVLNSSAPRAVPGDSEVISIFLSQKQGWAFRVADAKENSSVQSSFGLLSNQPAKAGDQEVFALESYSWNAATFDAMGSMTLGSIFVNGQKVDGGLYAYAGWDMVHSPLFIVGGAEPPQFASLEVNGSTATWSYSGQWQGDIQIGPSAFMAAAFILPLAVSLGVVIIGLLYVTGKTRRHVGGLPE